MKRTPGDRPDPDPRPTRLDVDGLLTIDFDSELRRVTEATLEGPWQVPAELVRRALAAHATRVDVQLQRGGTWRVVDDGDGLDAAAFEALAALLDEAAAPEHRHRALLALEAGHGLAALAGLRAERVSVASRVGEGTLVLRAAPGQRVRLEAAGAHETGTAVAVDGSALDVERARRFIQTAARFAGVPVVVDGRPVPAGFADALAAASLAPPLTGRLAIPRSGEMACVWLLVDGLVVSAESVPDVPVFTAAVEMGGLVRPTDGPGALREAIVPHLGTLADQAVALALVVVDEPAERPAADRQSIRRFLLSAARCGVRRSVVQSQPILPAVSGSDGRPAWSSLDDLALAAGSPPERGRVVALYPDQQPCDFLLPPAGPVFVLDGEERAQITALLGVAFRPPDVRPRPAGSRHWRRAAADLLRALTPWRSLQPLPASALLPRELALLDLLRGMVPDGVDLCRGSGPVRHVRRRLLLPRDNPLVRASARAVARDPAWAYPAALALLGGRSLPQPDARSRWLDGPGAFPRR